MHGLAIIIDILWIGHHKMIFYGLAIIIDYGLAIIIDYGLTIIK